MSITINNLLYRLPNQEVLFQDISFSISNGQKVSLVGNNGTGKSTLLRIIAGQLSPNKGEVTNSEKPYYIPQHFGQYNHNTVAEALGVDQKIKALQAILSGNVTTKHMECLDDDWEIESRIHSALSFWQIPQITLTQPMSLLSGGEKTKIFLSGIAIHTPEVVLMDEPSNHLDTDSRQMLYTYIQRYKGTMLIVSHDKTLLNQLQTTLEIHRKTISIYGGNYNFYAQQKQEKLNTLHQDIENKEKALRQAKDVEQKSLERQNKLDTRGKQKQEKAGLPTIMMKTLKNNAEKSTSKMKTIHNEKINAIAQQVDQLRKERPDIDKMKLNISNSTLHKHKTLIAARGINHQYNHTMLWPQPLDIDITSNERIVIKGKNGSGKTTLIKLLTGELKPQTGTIVRTETNIIYFDQDYTSINNHISIYQQVQAYNHNALQEHELKTRLNRFLFTQEHWTKPCSTLSGGERMRLMLCCLTVSNHSPDIIILDEPTNNLDIQNVEILTSAINEYQGALIVVSHDTHFLTEIGIEREVQLPSHKINLSKEREL